MDSGVQFLTQLSVEFRKFSQKQAFGVGIVFASITLIQGCGVGKRPTPTNK